MKRLRSIGTLVLAGTLLLGLTSSAWAADKVRLKVSVIHASKKAGKPDAKLAKIADQLRKAFGGFESFRQLDFEELKLEEGKKAELKLPNGKTAEFVYKGQDKKQHRINLAIPKSKVDVDLRAPTGRMFYQAGMAHEDGILILGMYLKPEK